MQEAGQTYSWASEWLHHLGTPVNNQERRVGGDRFLDWKVISGPAGKLAWP